MTPALLVRRTLVLVAGCAALSGCLVEYVLPGPDPTDTSGDSEDPEDSESGGDDDGEAEGCGDAGALCGEACVDLRSDPEHCGKCDERCDADELCVAGDCQRFKDTACDACPCAACGDGTQCCGAGEGAVYCLLTDDAPCPEGQ